MTTICNIDKKLLPHIDGLMLGDGCIQKHKYGMSAHYSQNFAFRYYGWTLEICSYLYNFGIDTTITSTSNSKYKYKRLCTYGHANKSIFPILRDRWYNGRINKNGWIIKTIPSDIDLSSPQLLANWYMGDGCYTNHKLLGNKYCVLATYGFTPQEVSDLRRGLSEALLINTILRKDNCIQLSVENSRIFLDYIKDYKVSCFNYKWRE